MAGFSFPFPLLCIDIGGTNARFAVTAKPGDAPSAPLHVKTGDYAGLAEAIEAIAPNLPERPHSVIACGAGPVVGRSLKLTNAPWVIDGPDVAKRTGLDQGLLLNDFEAQALSLPVLDEELGAADRAAEVRRRRPASDSRPGHRARGSARCCTSAAATRRSLPKRATSISAR